MSAYRQIILHAGLSKTGTTSIQQNCARHSAYLEERGIVYPQFRFGERPFLSHSIPITASITTTPGKYGLALTRRFPGDAEKVVRACKQQMDELLQSVRGKTLILSSELVESYDAADMASLRDYLEAHTDKLRVIIYIRSPESGLESLLQERLKAGSILSPENLVGRIKAKYQNLRRAFPDSLQVINYHDALKHHHGLSGSFFSLAGLEEHQLKPLEFVTRNQTLSLEAFRLMLAINQRYPGSEQEQHGVARHNRDLDVLGHLPGQAFHLQGFAGSEVHQACLEEAAWLEEELGLRFPRGVQQATGSLWQAPTLRALEPVLRRLKSKPMISVAAEFLRNEAMAQRESRPVVAEELETVAANLLSAH